MEDQFHILKSKIHRAVVTQAELDYIGSITIDEDLLDASGIFPFEKVLISNMRNGARVETYTIAGARGTGVICLNGPTAFFFEPADEVIIMAFKITDAKGARETKPIVIFPKNNNLSYEFGELKQ